MEPCTTHKPTVRHSRSAGFHFSEERLASRRENTVKPANGIQHSVDARALAEPVVSSKAIDRTIDYWSSFAGVRLDRATASEAVANIIGLAYLLRELQQHSTEDRDDERDIRTTQ